MAEHRVLPSLRGAAGGPTARAVGYAPKPDISDASDAPVCEAFETLLADWFGGPVVLLGSGRAGIIIHMKSIGAHRHRDTCLVPRFLPTCVTDTISRHALPVVIDAKPAVTLVYHQYGFPQSASPHGVLLEDICHAFFSTSHSGARPWQATAAFFSLPKFFGLRGMAGGLVLANESLAAAARELLDASETANAETADFIRASVTTAKLAPGPGASAYLEAAYALLNHYLHPDPRSLVGMPATLEALQCIGRRRREIVEGYLAVGARGMPADYRDGLARWMPYAFPYFGASDEAEERRICSELAQAGIAAGVYHVDVARNILAPDYRRCILIPCHHEISDAQREAVAWIIAS